ncbi:MAG: hypothetical protein HRT74_05150 [Flavobacteriales bacterium]|nr:hypothetical protein [Flavobacteriales bacterium]
MKKSILILLCASVALFACNDSHDHNNDQGNKPSTQETKKDTTPTGVEINDPRPEIKANRDSLSYNYNNITPNGFYPVNRASYTAINVMPIEPFEKLFMAWPNCSRKDEKVVVVDRRRFVLTPELAVSKDGDQINYTWNAPMEQVEAFLTRFSSDKIAIVINQKVMVIAQASALKGKESFSACDVGDIDRVQEMLHNPMEQKKEAEIPAEILEQINNQ